MAMDNKEAKKDDLYKIDRFNEQELTRLQRDYRNYANGVYALKEDKSKVRNLSLNLQSLKKEKKMLKNDLRVALGTTHIELYEKQMLSAEMHVACQESLQSKIDLIKTEIEHLLQQIKFVDKEIYTLTAHNMSDNQYKERIAKITNIKMILENRLDVSKRKECQIIRENFFRCEQIKNILYKRKLFNRLWMSMIKVLSYDKKFLIDMIESSILAFNQGSDLYNKLEQLTDKGKRDKKMNILDMLEIFRLIDLHNKSSQFLSIKGQYRTLMDLEPREYKRRDMFKEYHQKKLYQYNCIIDNIKKFTHLNNVDMIIKNFHKSEDEYFSHFNYMNELNKQIEIINCNLNFLYTNINALNDYNKAKETNQFKEIKLLNESLLQQIDITLEQETEKNNLDHKIMNLLNDITSIFYLLKCDNKKIIKLLGNHKAVTIFNIKVFLQIIELRINNIIGYLYNNERENNLTPYVIQDINHVKIEPTTIDDIILAQQCAECAEGEDVNRYDETIVMPLNRDEFLEKVREKVKAPEMQYRLHSISKCRLPRSRILVNKRYQ